MIQIRQFDPSILKKHCLTRLRVGDLGTDELNSFKHPDVDWFFFWVLVQVNRGW